MGNLNSAELLEFLLAVALMLGFGKAFGELFRKFKQAAVVGEIVAGIILGPTVFGLLFPELFEWIFPAGGGVSYAIDAITSLAIIFLLLAVGLEVDLSILFQYGKTALLTTILGMLFPFALGFLAAYFSPSLFNFEVKDLTIFALFIGTALSISALPIIARTLMDLEIFKTKMGMTIIAAAMFNDLIGWIAFSIFLSAAEAGGHSFPIGYTVLLTLVFTFVMIFLVRKLVNKIIPWIQSELSWPGGILGFIMIFGLAGAVITEKLGVHAILGAFIVGVTIGDSVHIKERTREIIQHFITSIFAPLFFVYIGLKINFIQAFEPVTVGVILLLGFAGKILGAGAGAYLGGFNKREAFTVGISMNSRGVLEIVLSIFALRVGVISEGIFVGIILLVISSSLLSGPLMKLILSNEKKHSFRKLLSSGNIILSESSNKLEVIEELVRVHASKIKLNKDAVLKKVLEREALISTGIGNYIAVPHAKIEIEEPSVAVAVSKNGLNFEAPDELPAKIIILLLTPLDKSELQLQLLAEIANSFRDRKKVEAVFNFETDEELISNLLKITSYSS